MSHDDRPAFGVNLTIVPTVTPPPYADYLNAIITSGVRIIETAGNNPKEFIGKLKAAGVTIVHKCTAVRHALSAERNGADIISIDGFECAGHPGEDDIPGLILIPVAARALKVPIVASGGLANGRGMAAALALGAHGISMGTRFLCTKEAPVHEDIKKLIVAGTERDTRLIFRTLRNTARVLKNAISDEVVELECRPGGVKFEEIRHLVAGARGREALQTGDANAGLVWASMATGLIYDIPSCAVLIERIVSECRDRLRTSCQLIPG